MEAIYTFPNNMDKKEVGSYRKASEKMSSTSLTAMFSSNTDVYQNKREKTVASPNFTLSFS